MLERKLITVGLGLVASLSACSKSDPTSGPQAAASEHASSAPKADTVVNPLPSVVSADGTPRVLPGTGIQIALPPGTERMGRELSFRIPSSGGQQATLVRIDRRVWNTEEAAVSAVGRTAGFLGMANEFFADGDPVLLTESPERALLWGTTPANVLGDAPEQPGAVVATRGVAGSRVFLRASFADADRSVVEGIAKTIDIADDAQLDPFSVHGLEMAPLPEGYSLAPGQLAPLWVMAPGQPQPFVGPTFELRFFGPGQLQPQIDRLLATLRGKRSSCDGEAGNGEAAKLVDARTAKDSKPSGSTVPAASAVPKAGAVPKASAVVQPASAVQPSNPPLETVRCKFDAPRGEDAKADIQLHGFQDDKGAVIAITLVPQAEPEHTAVFEKLAQSIRLKPPAQF